jgi:prepilin-type N-terminal cleavage/methylation domain-containing protein
MKNNGFSIIELVVVVGIIGLLLSIVSINFGQWQLKSNIERQANEMYMEIAEARQLALHTRQARTITFSANNLVFKRYTSDTDLESGEGVEVKTKNLRFPIIHSTWVDPSDNPNITSADILFTTRGIMDQVTPNSICIFSDVGPSADAIVIVYSRVGLGKIKSQGSKGVADCATANIDIK